MPPLRGSKNVYQCLTQGLRPGLCRSIALTGLIYVFPINILYHFDVLAPCVYVLEHWTYRRGYIQVLLCRLGIVLAEKCTAKVLVNNEIEIQICY